MKKIFLVTGFIFCISNAAFAQEIQTYSFDGTPRYGGSANVNTNVTQTPPPVPVPNDYRVYPGREVYGEEYGYLPRHPGDYRDAVDRGSWTAGGPAPMPRRSASGY